MPHFFIADKAEPLYLVARSGNNASLVAVVNFLIVSHKALALQYNYSNTFIDR